MEKDLVESSVGAVHSSVKYTLSKTERTGNQIEMGQQNFGQSDQGCYQPAIQLFMGCYKQRFSQFIWRFNFRDTTVFFFPVKDVAPDVSLVLYQKKRKRITENNVNISPASLPDKKSIAFLSLQNEIWYACCICTL